MLTVQKRGRKISRPQKAALLEFIKQNPRLLCRKFDKNFGLKDARILWEKLTRHIHTFPGARKTWVQWRKVWQDLQRKVFHNDETLQRLTMEVNTSVKMERNENHVSVDTFDPFDDEDSQSSESNPDINFAEPTLRDFISNEPNTPMITTPRQDKTNMGNMSPIVKLAQELMKDFRGQVKAEKEYRRNHLKLIKEQTDAIKSLTKTLQRLV